MEITHEEEITVMVNRITTNNELDLKKLAEVLLSNNNMQKYLLNSKVDKS